MVTLQEAAVYLRVTRSTIDRMLRRKQVPAFRIGRTWRFKLEIDTWCSSRMVRQELNRDGTARNRRIEKTPTEAEVCEKLRHGDLFHWERRCVAALSFDRSGRYMKAIVPR